MLRSLPYLVGYGLPILATLFINNNPAQAQVTLFQEDFTQPTVSGWTWGVGDGVITPLQQPCTTASPLIAPPVLPDFFIASGTLPGCNTNTTATGAGAPTPDAAGLGTLRLTPNLNDQSGFIFSDASVPSTFGLQITFDFFSYRGNTGGNGSADGVTFFLFDAATPTPGVGGFGGSLGYAQKQQGGTNIPGLAGGYLGIGYDEFGNFTNDFEGRGNGSDPACPLPPAPLNGSGPAPEPGGFIRPNSVAIRGPGNGQNGYCFIGSSVVDGFPGGIPGGLADPGTNTRGSALRTARVTIDPVAGVVRAEISFDGGATFTTVVTDKPLPPGIPPLLRFGFAASTGGQTNIHEIRNLRITTSPSAAPQTISGRVFEDVNYGGGAGRSFVTAAGVGRPAARVELYNAAGNLVSFTVTDANGNYQFAVAPGNYTVRVVNNTVNSSRPGNVAGLLPVQTFRTVASSGTAVADVDRVGGENPAGVDAAATAVNGTLPAAAQSITPVTVTAGNNVAGIDFGYNFDTIVNTNDTGQGSLRQFIINSNALTNAGLAQVGQPAGQETSIFMIPGGTAVAGLRAGLPNQLTGGVAVINPATALPAITDTNTAIDGLTQTANVGNTNLGTFGTAGTVGTGADGRTGTADDPTLTAVNRPEVQITDTAGLAIGLDVQANNTTIRGTSILGFGNTANTIGNANIRVGNNFTTTLIEQNFIGTVATAFADPGAARSGGDNLRLEGADQTTIRNNLIGFSAGQGLNLSAAADNNTITNNEIRGNGIGNPTLGGVGIIAGGTNTIAQNLITANQGPGVDSVTGSNTINNNTITSNGSGSTATGVTAGVRVGGTGSTVNQNVISDNTGAGVMVVSGGATNTISQNSIFNNGNVPAGAGTGQLGIDLLAAGDNQTLGTSPFVTINDNGDGDVGGNGLLNYPIIESAQVVGTNLVIQGFARPGSQIEFFLAQLNPNAPNPSSASFGQGRTFLVTQIEGSAADTDATTGTYGPAAVNGIAQGTDNTNRFTFTIPVAGLPAIATGDRITATATIGQATSEFSGLTTVTVPNVPPNVLLVKRITRINNTDINGFVDDPGTLDDNNANWPAPTTTSLRGAIDGGTVNPGDVVEYTIYFVNTGGRSANNFSVCDRVPTNSAFLETAFNGSTPTDGGLPANLGIALASSNVAVPTAPTNFLTVVGDLPDRGQFYPAGNTPPAPINCGGANDNGAVVVNLGNIPNATAPGTPTNSYGFIRFRTTVR